MTEKNIKRLTSFVEGADTSLFPLYNLPYGVFRTKDNNTARVGTAIGNFVLDLALLEKERLLNVKSKQTLFNKDSLNDFAAAGQNCWSSVRERLQLVLSADNDELQLNKSLLARALIPTRDIEMMLPFKIRGFTDFYASIHHATNVGKLFRGKDNPLLPNWKHLPVAYNGRASTIFRSGIDILRPNGQIKYPEHEEPIYGPTNKLDFELELGYFIGQGNTKGQRIPIRNAKNHIFGVTLLNDWSARDIQAFEYQPLGPFLSKSFATSISPWVVPMEALEFFMKAKPKQLPEVTNYLKQDVVKQPDINLKVEIQPKGSHIRTTLCETNSMELYWSIEQMLAHHTVNHCIMQTGDLLGTGTISGPNKENWGSLLEITYNGTQPITLNDENERRFLEDGDTIIITGFCQADHYQIGFGSIENTIIPSQEDN